ncbi:8-oxoguanine deaminase [Hartmannibacter diazotrophicus]|uniref:8-oxoguanine deaminase n=1 Tax=Hartmannibacter diazotrophicus TaxID=1482074 RepID=A0A2C9CZV4_9HYPH|nr:formimidoylglutamate deiminase [Hartmannibacter diazotrophicus]SON53677.1 8-oxoguanine deaminase [Hartmannibacter diazotrophicus]
MSIATSRTLHAARALLPEGWRENVRFGFGADGLIASVETDVPVAAGDEIANGPVIPAMVDLHSHAFQRAMAGLAEVSGPGEDTFWTWREEMYRTVGLLSPEDVEAVAAKLYVEMLKSGFGAVCEFHYVHNDRDGTPYADRAELAARILAAKETSGIGLTLIPVFYAHGNFGGAAPNPGQRRFLNDVDGFLKLIDASRDLASKSGAHFGTSIHSLRAATPDEMNAVLAAAGDGPIHIHVAEQQKEVDDCLAWSGRRPIDWLMDEMPVDERWCLIHATHHTDGELRKMAASGAVVGLCPTTESSLGDGIFSGEAFLRLGGRFGVGTDSHVSTSPSEELRTLEYSQRLRDQKRVRLAGGPNRSNGRHLFDTALKGGAQAAGWASHGLQAGAPASLVVLDGSHAFITAAKDDAILDRWIFSLGDRAVRDVMAEGHWRIRDGRHADDEAIDAAFRAAILRLQG